MSRLLRSFDSYMRFAHRHGPRTRWRDNQGRWHVRGRVERFIEPALLLLLSEQSDIALEGGWLAAALAFCAGAALLLSGSGAAGVPGAKRRRPGTWRIAGGAGFLVMNALAGTQPP